MQTHPMILSSPQLLKIIFMIFQHSNTMCACEESKGAMVHLCQNTNEQKFKRSPLSILVIPT